MAGGIIEQVPRYKLNYTDNGTEERLQLTVILPGVASSKEFQVTVQPDRFELRAEGRYHLTLPLNPPVDEKPKVLQFVKKKALLKAELRVLTAAESLHRATVTPAAEAGQAYALYGASQPPPGLSASPAEQRIHAALRTGVNVLATNTASHLATASAGQDDRPPGLEDRAPSTADQNDSDPASQWVWDQLVARQGGSGYGSDDSRSDRGADTRSTASSSSRQPSDTVKAGSLPSLSPADAASLPATNSHHANGFATQTDNPLWSPGSPFGSVSPASSVRSPTTPSQADAEQNGDRQFGSTSKRPAVVQGSEQAQPRSSTAPQAPGSLRPKSNAAPPGPSTAWLRPSSAQPGPGAASPRPETSQQTAEPVKRAASAAEQGSNVLRHREELGTAQHQPDKVRPLANGLHASEQAAASGTDAESEAASTTPEPEGSSTDIYQAAKIMNNKKAAKEFYDKGQQAVRQHNWSQAGRLLSKACSLDRDYHEHLAGVFEKMDKKFVPRLKKHMSPDLLKAYPGSCAEPAGPADSSKPAESVKPSVFAKRARPVESTKSTPSGWPFDKSSKAPGPAQQSSSQASGAELSPDWAATEAWARSNLPEMVAQLDKAREDVARAEEQVRQQAAKEKEFEKWFDQAQAALERGDMTRTMELSKKALESYCTGMDPNEPEMKKVMDHFLKELLVIEASGNFSSSAPRPSSLHDDIEAACASGQRPQQSGSSPSAADRGSTSYSFSGTAVPNRQHDMSGQGFSEDSSRESSPRWRSSASHTHCAQSDVDQEAAQHQAEPSPRSSQSWFSSGQEEEDAAADTAAQSDGAQSEGGDAEGPSGDWQPWKEDRERSEGNSKSASDSVSAILALWFRFRCWAWRACKSSAAFCWTLISGAAKGVWARTPAVGAPVKRGLAKFMQPFRPALNAVLTAILVCFAILLVVISLVWELLPLYILLLLHMAGKRQWAAKLSAAKKRGDWSARFMMWIVSPLLAAATLWWFACTRPGREVSSMFAAVAVLVWQWGKWPVVWLWKGFLYTFSWIQSGWIILPISALGWLVVAQNNAHRVLCVDGLLWWSLGSGWFGLAAAVLATFASGPEFGPCHSFTAHATIWTCYQVWVSDLLRNWILLRGAAVVIIICFWSGGSAKPFSSNPSQPEPRSSPAPADGVPLSRPSSSPKEEVKRILAATSHYHVLEVDTNAAEDAIKRARKMKALLVHPDKVGPDVAGANDAFGKVTLAAEVLTDPVQRRQYDRDLADAQQEAASPSMAREDDDENVFWQNCGACGGKHKVIRKPNMSHQQSRWCKEHDCFHPVKKGDGWVTFKHKGFFGIFSQEYLVYACLHPDGDIYDVTELAACQGMLESLAFRQLGVDCCKIWLTFNPHTTHQERRKQGRQQRHERANQQSTPNHNAGGQRTGRKGRKKRR